MLMQSEACNNYRIEVRSLGYDTTEKIITAPSLAAARLAVPSAIAEWCWHNDVTVEHTYELPFTRVSRVN